MGRRSHRNLLAGACLAAAGLVTSPDASAKISVAFDFSLDAQANNFFNANSANGQAARASLTRAAQYYEDRILESNLPAINPPFAGSWSGIFRNPATGQDKFAAVDMTIPANTIKVFVAGRSNLADGAIAEGGFGGYSVNETASAQFRNDVGRRGQAGMQVTPPATDFGTWGGAIAFNRNTTWNYGAAAPTGSQQDFFTIALHEIGHVLGVGLAPSFRTNQTAQPVPGGRTQYVGPYTGAKTKALYGGNVPLETVPGVNTDTDPVAHASHFAEGLMSTLDGVVQQETIFDPTIAPGTRKKLTLLDWAALDDTGWDLARPGDATADGGVNFDDLLALAQNYNVNDGARRWSQGDFNYDGNVNFDDLLQLAQNYNTFGMAGQPVAGATAGFEGDWQTALAMAGVPEPATVGALATVAGVGLLRRRRR